jgi:hypothetical protein
MIFFPECIEKMVRAGGRKSIRGIVGSYVP